VKTKASIANSHHCEILGRRCFSKEPRFPIDFKTCTCSVANSSLEFSTTSNKHYKKTNVRDMRRLISYLTLERRLHWEDKARIQRKKTTCTNVDARITTTKMEKWRANFLQLRGSWGQVSYEKQSGGRKYASSQITFWKLGKLMSVIVYLLKMLHVA
jgi:hypothetical protein